jgi:hypothetical protein
MNRGSSAISKLLGNLLDQPTSFAGGRALKPVAAKRKGEVSKSSHSPAQHGKASSSGRQPEWVCAVARVL